jgi:flagellar biosynthesis activator protein FlaF
VTSNPAQAYARVSQTTSSPRSIEAQALMKAARQLQDVRENWVGPDARMHDALLFNRRLWAIFLSAVESNDNPQPLEIRQNIANISVFVLKQTLEMQTNPEPQKLISLIEINRNIAAGLSGRA